MRLPIGPSPNGGCSPIPGLSSALALEARSGLPIQNEVRPEMPYEVLEAGIDVIVNGYPDLKPLSSSATYNCFGLVFASRRAWLEDPPVSEILDADGYRLLPLDPVFWCEGDLVVYVDEKRNPIHVGIVWEIRAAIMEGEFDVRVLSKWGQSGEFLHPFKTGHLSLGYPAQVWTQRFSR